MAGSESSAEVAEVLRRRFGKHVVALGPKQVQLKRLPTGVFPLDLATGGGFPRGRISVVYGNESSGKTSLCLRAIAEFQLAQGLRPEKKRLRAVFVDVEGTTDEKLARSWGVDWGALYYVAPDYAEVAVDAVQAFLEAKDVGLVVVDSIAMLTATAEADMEKSAEDAERAGGGGLLGKRLMMKSANTMNRVRVQHGRTPTLVVINQTRTKVGVVYGNPETMPGGVVQKFAASLIVRLWGKSKVEEKWNKAQPARLEVQGRVTKKKVPIVAEAFEYALVLAPHKGLKPGTVDDFHVVKEYAEAAGFLARDGKQWRLALPARPPSHFSTLDALAAKLAEDVALRGALRSAIVAHALGPQEAGT